MAQPTQPELDELEVEPPNISQIVIEDDEPVDSLLQEKHSRLLTEPLYTSWEGPPPWEDGRPRSFIAASNVGVFSSASEPPLVPDAFLSLDVQVHQNQNEKRHRTYFIWEFGKPPDIAIEIVSNRRGGELDRKKRGYARMRIAYYAVWDPLGILGEPALSCFELRANVYVPLAEPWFPALGLGLAVWDGSFENLEATWLRWRREDGSLIVTGAERALDAEAHADTAEARADTAEARADIAEARADTAEARADTAEARADSAEARANRLAEKLRALGEDPTDS